jgi:hypothetical protein
MPDSGAIDAALIALLAGDATLSALMPDGVYYDVADADAEKFVIVSLAESHDEPEFQQRAWEENLYLVKAVALDSSAADVRAAAARIDALLENGTLTVSGLTCMSITREQRLRIVEDDDVDAAIRWQHLGGYYRVMMSVN